MAADGSCDKANDRHMPTLTALNMGWGFLIRIILVSLDNRVIICNGVPTFIINKSFLVTVAIFRLRNFLIL